MQNKIKWISIFNQLKDNMSHGWIKAHMLRRKTLISIARQTDLEISSKVTDGYISLVVVIQSWEAPHVHVDLVLREVDGNVFWLDFQSSSHLHAEEL